MTIVAPVAAEKRTATILIVDDDPDIREELSDFLDLCGYRTRTASNGQDGFEAAMTADFAIIIMDVNMPLWDGLRAATAMTAMRPGQRIILMSGDPDSLEEAVDRQGLSVTVWPKPIDLANCRRTLDGLL